LNESIGSVVGAVFYLWGFNRWRLFRREEDERIFWWILHCEWPVSAPLFVF